MTDMEIKRLKKAAAKARRERDAEKRPAEPTPAVPPDPPEQGQALDPATLTAYLDRERPF